MQECMDIYMGDLRILYSLFFSSTIPVTSSTIPVTSMFSTSMWRIHPRVYIFFISSFSYIQSQPLTLSYKPQSPWSLITIPPRVVGLKYFTWSEEPGRLQFTMLWRVGYDWATKSMHTHSLRTITQYSSSCVLDFQCYKTLNSSISNPSNLSFHSPNISIPLA